MNKQAKPLRAIIGVVVSDKMDKTVVVRIDRKVKHPLYGKYVTHSQKVHVHVEKNGECKEGDFVKIVSCRPVSKTKTWRFLEVVERAS